MSSTLTDRVASLEKKSTLFWMTAGCLLVAGIGVVDLVTGREISFSLFYLLPIALVAWFSGRNPGLVVSVIAGVVWFAVDSIDGPVYSRPVIGYWNGAARLGFFVLVPLLLPQLKALEREKAIARLDDLTGTANRRHLFEVLQAELDRSQRYKRPFTVAYIDLDDFKAVNDQFGHRTGDEVLHVVANLAKSHLRKTDLVGRLGGDEFILLLPEVNSDIARVVVGKVQSALLDEMRRKHWSVTFSIGAFTHVDGPISADELIKRADDLMYAVKRNGKNAIAYATS